MSTFLTTFFSSPAPPPPPDRPYVTLTFAQSIDAKIGFGGGGDGGGGQLVLSGQESMIMTHRMRTMHDAILIGIGTALNDDPQLNIRLLPQPEGNNNNNNNNPRPVILDKSLRLHTTCKLLKNFQAGTGRRPWLFCASSGCGTTTKNNDGDDEQISTKQEEAEQQASSSSFNDRKRALQKAGARIFEIEIEAEIDPAHPNANSNSNSFLSIPCLLTTLRSNGIESLIVEGGASVIASFLSRRAVVDKIVVTIAPVLIGDGGAIGYRLPNVVGSEFQVAHTETFGKDTVIALHCR